MTAATVEAPHHLGPEHPHGRLLGPSLRPFAGLAAVGVAAWPLLPEMGVVCPLRRATGVPCPFCGMTTGALATAHGDLAAAAAANPLAPLAVATLVAAVAWPFLTGRELPLRARPVAVLLTAVLPLLWLYELHRFSFL